MKNLYFRLYCWWHKICPRHKNYLFNSAYRGYYCLDCAMENKRCGARKSALFKYPHNPKYWSDKLLAKGRAKAMNKAILLKAQTMV